MSGLAIMTQTFATPTATGNMNIDIIRELGLTQEKLIFDQRTKALTKPGDYTDERNIQFAKMAQAVNQEDLRKHPTRFAVVWTLNIEGPAACVQRCRDDKGGPEGDNGDDVPLR